MKRNHTQNQDEPAEVPRARGGLRRRIGLALLVALVLLLGAAGLGLHLTRSTPAYWQKNENFIAETEPRKLNAIAGALETQVLKLQSYQGPLPGEAGPANGPPAEADNTIRHFRMSAEQANAWLATKLQKWLRNQRQKLPRQIQRPTVHIDGDDLVLGCRWMSGGRSDVVSVMLGVQLTEDGGLRFARKGIFWGRLPVPYGLFLQRVRMHMPSSRRKLIDRITEALEGREMEPVIPYEGDATGKQQYRLVDLRLEKGTIDLTLRIEPVPEKPEPQTAASP